MKVLLKLNQARKLFHAHGMEKTGRNEYANYSYFQLSDFLPDALAAFEEVGLNGLISFGLEMATMKITDLESGESDLITVPMSTAQLKGCHPVQNLGAVTAYLRRYLWAIAVELVEADPVDSSPPTPPSQSKLAPLPTRPVKPTAAAKHHPAEGEALWRNVTLDEKEKTISKTGKTFWKCSFDNGEHTNVFEQKDADPLVEGNEYTIAVAKDKTGKYWNFRGVIEKELEESPALPKGELNWVDEVTACEQVEGKNKWAIRFFQHNDTGWTLDKEVAIKATLFEEHSKTVVVTGVHDASGHLWIKEIKEDVVQEKQEEEA